MQYAPHAFGIEEPDIEKMEPFTGPPLMDSFMEFYDMTKERAAEAIDKYRERFSVTGWSENIVYEGVPHMLKSLRDAGYVLAVASSKPTVFVERILTHFGLRDAFSVVVGSELDGRRINKDEVIREALRQLFAGQDDEQGSGQNSGSSNAVSEGIRYDDLLMIGDRKFDVEGAHALGIRCVGVTYGYAQPGELTEAQADFLAASPDKLLELLLELRETDDVGLCAAEEKCGGKQETKGGTRHA